MVSAPFATNNTVAKGTKLPESRTVIRKLSFTGDALSLSMAAQFLRCRGTLFFGYSGAKYAHFMLIIIVTSKSLFRVVENNGFTTKLRSNHPESPGMPQAEYFPRRTTSIPSTASLISEASVSSSCVKQSPLCSAFPSWMRSFCAASILSAVSVESVPLVVSSGSQGDHRIVRKQLAERLSSPTAAVGCDWHGAKLTRPQIKEKKSSSG